MLHTCYLCGKMIQEGQRVSVTVDSTYHVLKSTIAFALDKTDMEADSSTLCHTECLNA